ncbi:hypothetical protein FRUB_00795 [Fimbriiglobus ruber]|uniref:Uncharacterized protein n=1 Tax=Fimbriiglobus ruber TaxID=1908690 RepID=A0A225EAN5_9BACT|nr:hypothetical protein FRUB_00795 [Fimbriiglobus ruber]
MGLLLPSGCGDSIKVYPVRGKVTFEGKPLVGGGSIALVPIGTQRGKTAGGEIGPDGSFELMTHKPGDGSMTGEFRVVVIQQGDKEPSISQDGEKAKKVISTVAKEDRIPAIYSDHYKTPLTATVEAKSVNELNIDLKRSATGATGEDFGPKRSGGA